MHGREAVELKRWLGRLMMVRRRVMGLRVMGLRVMVHRLEG